MKQLRGVLLSVVMGLVAVMPLTAMAVSSGGIGGRPANPDPTNPRSQSIFIYTLDHGATKSDQIYVNNAGEESATILLYAVDGITSNTGAYTCKQKAEPATDLGAWLKLSKTEVTLAAKQNVLVDFTLTMPKDADVGEHNGCIVFQSKDDPGQVSGGGVRVQTRQAVRVVATVPGDLRREVSIESFTATSAGTKQDYAFKLKNEGNVSADVDAKVRVTDWFGNVAFEDGGSNPVIANRTLEAHYASQLQPFFGGFYKVQVVASYDKRAGRLGVSDQSQLITKKSEEKVIFIQPSIWAIILAILLLIGIVFMIIRSSRRRRAKQPRTGAGQQRLWGKYEVKSGDTLASLARKYAVSTEKLATLNKLSASSTLTPGQHIYVPRKK